MHLAIRRRLGPWPLLAILLLSLLAGISVADLQSGPTKRVSIVLFLSSPIQGKVMDAYMSPWHASFSEQGVRLIISNSSTQSTLVMYTRDSYPHSGDYTLAVLSTDQVISVNFTLSNSADTGGFWLVELQV